MCIPTMGATRQGELSRTAEMMVQIAKKHEGDELRIVAETLYMLRSTNRTGEQDLADLQSILDAQIKNRTIVGEEIVSLPKEC